MNTLLLYTILNVLNKHPIISYGLEKLPFRSFYIQYPPSTSTELYWAWNTPMCYDFIMINVSSCLVNIDSPHCKH